QDKNSAVLMAPVITDLAAAFAQKLAPCIKLAFFDADIPSAPRVCFSGQDAYTSGTLAARLMAMLCFNKGRVDILSPPLDDIHIKNRIRGFCDHLNYFAELNYCLHTITNLEDREQIESFFKKTDSPVQSNGIFIPNSVVFQTAVFLEKKGLHHIHLIAYDLLPKNIPYLKNNTIDFLISQQPFRQGYESIRILYRSCLFSEKTAAANLLPIDIITKENYLFYKNNERRAYAC
ncbi:MAG TPA: substrate-binding domain-containing protein, partial [Spirochaetota bacterium]|nr:substrate-binding domain-containing protein [Spirochaetota bacterium]